MAVKTKRKRVLKAPKVRSSIPASEIRKAIKKVAAARRFRKPESVSDAAE